MFGRWVEPLWKKEFGAPYVHLVFSARQTASATRRGRRCGDGD